MKFYLKVLLGLVLLFAVAVPLLLKGPDGKPVMSVGDWIPTTDELIGLARQAAQKGEDLTGGSIGHLSEQAASVVSGDAMVENAESSDVERAPTQLTSQSGKMYKWQDENGRWHFSSQKPTNISTVSLADLPRVENVMEAPVGEESNGSMMSLPGIGDAGDILKKVQRMAAERDQ